MDSNFLLYILLYLNIVSFILGYLFSNIRATTYILDNNKYDKNIRQKSSNVVSTINIEDDKYVVAIDTSNIEKKYDTLGDVKQTTENISNSIDKLKNLKR